MASRIPIRWRLACLAAALLGVTLAASGILVYFGLRAALYDDFRERVINEGHLTLTGVSTVAGDPVLAPGATVVADDDHFVRLLATDGRVLADTSLVFGQVPIDGAAVRQAQAGVITYDAVAIPSETLGVATLPVKSGNTVVGVLQVGLSRQDADDSLGSLLTIFSICVPLALLAALGGGYFLAGRALAPVSAITTLAGQIGGTSDDLHARLGLSLPDDELGRLARTFDAMLARIEQSFERQRRFTADAAHELRTPLALMRGQIDLALARPRSADAYRAALQELDTDLERISSLVHALLTLARADSGQLELSRSTIDVADTIAAVAEQYTDLAAVDDITITMDCQPATAPCDTDLLVQVLVNLLDNALAHTPAGGRIELGCRQDDAVVRLWVHDTGSGIAPEHLPYVFERFYRVDGGRVRGRGGAGLGLDITRAIVTAHGGRIDVTSDQRHGTQVEVVLPSR